MRGSIINYRSLEILERSQTTSADSEDVDTWSSASTATMHIQPAGTSVISYGKLFGAKIDMQAYARPPIEVDPITNRIRDATVDYHIRQILHWPAHTELYLERVIEP